MACTPGLGAIGQCSPNSVFHGNTTVGLVKEIGKCRRQQGGPYRNLVTYSWIRTIIIQLASTPIVALIIPAVGWALQIEGSEQNAVNAHLTNSTQIQNMVSAKHPLSFVANSGQTDPKVRYYVRGEDYEMFFTGHEVVFSAFGQLDQNLMASVVHLSFPGASPHAEVEGLEKLPGVANFLTGNDPTNW